MAILKDPTIDKKGVEVENLLRALPQLADVNFWRGLNPSAAISNFHFVGQDVSNQVNAADIDAYTRQLQEERYFQSPVLLPEALTRTMRQCIEQVEQAGFPAIFALVYDVFYEGMGYLDSVIKEILGKNYRLIPNFWIYHIDSSEKGKGFEPHRDTEYTDTIDDNGLPTVLTLWVAVTDATPLNSCMYVLPANRDPDYAKAIHTLDKIPIKLFPLEDIRAIPAKAGSLSCWDQYLMHWGSRSSKYAKEPRISYAFYCQRGDIPPVDDAWIDLSLPLTFEHRLALVCRGLNKYSRLNLKSSEHTQPLQAFLEEKQAELVHSTEEKVSVP